MEFLNWHYSKGLDYYILSWSNTLKWLTHYFSLGLLVRTLFAPWKRMIEVDTSPGFNIQKRFEVFTFNIISRGVGATVRLVLFGVGIVLIFFTFLGGGIGLILWMVLPIFDWSVYSKWKRQPENFMKELMFKLKSSKESTLNIIFENEAGSFVLTHTGLSLEEIFKNANVEKIKLQNFLPKSFQEIITRLVENKVWSEQFFNSSEMSGEDLILAASWWDRIQYEATKIGEESSFGRPGIALELTFGYTPTLNQYSIDLSTPQSFFHHLIGRVQVVSRMERVLSSGNSVLLMGEPGVGKKTVVLEFAKRAATGEFGREMAYKRVLEFDYNSLLAGVADLNRKKNELTLVLAEAAAAGNIILMIRDIHRLTNRLTEGYDFTDILEGHLEKRVLKIIAVSTNSDYERYVAPNSRLRKYLERIEVIPPTKEEALQIVIEAASRWENLTGIVVTIPTLRYILEESDRYVTDVPYPEKVLEFLDAIISYVEQKGKYQATIDDAGAVLGEKTGISFARLTDAEKKKLGQIEDIIHKRLIDQETAVDLIAKTLRAKAVGVIKEDRPLGSFLFLGPTGVGKTETAKVLAKVYFGSEENILRFDMAEYSGGEGMERLIGSVSKNLPGALTTAIKNRPASLLLLDEIEKASREIYNLFLSLLDEGFITDAFGKKIICRNLFVIGTSNAGAEYIRGLVDKGITGSDLQTKVVNRVLEAEIFSPEFLNRFDGVVVYQPLKPEDLLEVAKLMLSDLSENLKKKNIILQVDPGAIQKLARDGYEPAYGARPMIRIVNLSLGDLLGRAVLKGEIKEGDKIRILPGDKKDEFRWEKV